MLEHLPLIVFLVTFVLIFVLRMPIPAGMIAACTLYGSSFIRAIGWATYRYRTSVSYGMPK